MNGQSAYLCCNNGSDDYCCYPNNNNVTKRYVIDDFDDDERIRFLIFLTYFFGCFCFIFPLSLFVEWRTLCLMRDAWCRVSIRRIRYCKSAAWRGRIGRIWSTCWRSALIGSRFRSFNIRRGPEKRRRRPTSPCHGEDRKTVLLRSRFVGEYRRIVRRDHGREGWFGCRVRAGRRPDSEKANHRRVSRPVVVATQMLESMIESSTPTRAKASDITTAIYHGGDAMMLSAESAAGSFPEESVRLEEVPLVLQQLRNKLLTGKLEITKLKL